MRPGCFVFRLAQRRGAIPPSDPGRSVAVMVRCVAVWDRLAADHPDVANFEHDRAGMYYYLNLSYRAARDEAAALRSIEKSIAILTRLAQQHPENRTYQRELSQYDSVSGDIFVNEGQLEKALERQQRAAAIDPGNPRPFDRMAANLSSYRDPKQRDPLRDRMGAKGHCYRAEKSAILACPGRREIARASGSPRDSFNNSMLLQNGGDGLDWYYLAMADWRLGNKQSARDYFQKARAWKKHEREGEDDLRRLDQEVASLLNAPPGQPVSAGSKVLPNSAFPH